MGSRPSPYNAVLYYYLAEEFVRGNPTDTSNPFYWDKLLLNLPGSLTFDPTRPRIMKWDSRNGWIACDLVVFVDDLRASGPTAELTWSLSRTVSSRLQYLGMQEASRKRRPPSRTPGAWAGGVFKTSATDVSASVSQDKWNKAKLLINTLWKVIEEAGVACEGDDFTGVYLDYKQLEVTRGYLVHMSMTYEMLSHHLKGFHLALAAHLPGRALDRWKMTSSEWEAYLLLQVEKGVITQEELTNTSSKLKSNFSTPPPTSIPIIQHLRDDIYALHKFFDLGKPPEVQARRHQVHLLLYGFADASGGGLGSTVTILGVGVRCRVGVWGKDDEFESSNYKEFENVVMTVEEEAR
jgi:hypothetical protein